MPSYQFKPGGFVGGLGANGLGRGIHTLDLRQEAFNF
jgi:hypothetical protein